MLLAALFSACQAGIPPKGTADPVGLTSAAPTAGHIQIAARISVPRAVRVAFGEGSIWVSNPAERTITRMDPGTGSVIGSPLGLDFEPREITYGEGALWVCSADRSHLARIDPLTNELIAEVDLRSLQIPDDVYLLLAAGEGAVWLTDQRQVIQVDPQTNQLVGQPLPAGEEVITVALGHGTLWAGSHDDGLITRVEAETHRVVATIEAGFSVHGLAVSDASAWVLDEHGYAVVRIDPQSNRLQERVPIDFVGSNLAAGAGSVWVAPAAQDGGQPTGEDGIARLNEQEGRIAETVHVGGAGTSNYYSVTFSEGSLWVLVDAPETSLIRIIPSGTNSP